MKTHSMGIILRRLNYLVAIAAASTALLPAQTCPPVSFVTTPRILSSGNDAVGLIRQNDGSFTAYFGTRKQANFGAAFLQYRQTSNYQAAITSCFPVTKRSGSTPFSSYVRDGLGAQVGDWADLDGDGIPDSGGGIEGTNHGGI